MELCDLQVLLWLIEHGSLKAAARATGSSRTTLRRRLERLEASVGAPLLRLRQQQLQLTPTGALLADRGRELLAQRDTLLGQARRLQAAPDNTIKILSGLGFPPPLTAQLMAWCDRAHPALRIELHFSLDPLRAIDDDYDLLIYWGDALPDRDGFSRAILRPERRVMASPGYLAAHGTPTSIDALSEHRIIQHTDEPDAWPLLGGGQVPVQAVHRVGDLYLLGCLIGAGVGLGMIPRQSVAVHPSMQDLVPVLEAELGTAEVMRFFAPVRTENSAAAVIVAALEDLAAQFAALSP